MAKLGANFTNAHGLIHPSQHNYIGLFSGNLQGMTGRDCLPEDSSLNTSNLGAALSSSGYSFKGYAESLPEVGFKGCTDGESELIGKVLYGGKHAPWVNWQGSGKFGLPASVSLPFSTFPEEFNDLPTVALVIPNMDNDMHNNGGDPDIILQADQWLEDRLSDYIEWAQHHNSLFILSYEEDNDTWLNHIPTIFVGEMVEPGDYDDSISLYHILWTTAQMYELPESGDAKTQAITSIWKK